MACNHGERRRARRVPNPLDHATDLLVWDEREVADVCHGGKKWMAKNPNWTCFGNGTIETPDGTFSIGNS